MFHKNLNINGEDYPIAVNISGHGAPTTSTEGAVDMLYRNLDDNSVYQCIAAENGVYTWKIFLFEVVQSAGNSTMKVMSQKAVTDLINAFANNSGAYDTVDSVEEMTDTSKSYVLSSTGTIWSYGEVEVEEEKEVTEHIVGTANNPFEMGRLSSGAANGAVGYITTPYIDLSKYSGEFDLHLEGIPFSNETPMGATASDLRYSLYGIDKAHLITGLTNGSSFRTQLKNITFTDTGGGAVKISFTSPVTNKSDVQIGYARFSGYGSEENANVYVVYKGKIPAFIKGWYDTGISARDITEFNLTNPSVEAFMASIDYNTDATTSVVDKYCKSDYYRKDLPFCLYPTR